MKNEVGITLVALIVTIIILLILAGISIQGLTQTGLFEKANQSKRTTENSQEEENIILGSYENKINEIVDSSTRENNSAQQQPNSQNTMSGEEHFIGEYYFNGKPIYEKTIYINSLSNKAGMKDYNHKISNVDEIWFNTSKSFIKVLNHSTVSGKKLDDFDTITVLSKSNIRHLIPCSLSFAKSIS